MLEHVRVFSRTNCRQNKCFIASSARQSCFRFMALLPVRSCVLGMSRRLQQLSTALSTGSSFTKPTVNVRPAQHHFPAIPSADGQGRFPSHTADPGVLGGDMPGHYVESSSGATHAQSRNGPGHSQSAKDVGGRLCRGHHRKVCSSRRKARILCRRRCRW